MKQKSRKRYGRVLQTGSPPGSRIRDGFPAGFFMRRPAGLYKDRASCRDALCHRIWAAGLRKTQVRRRNCSGFAGRERGRAAFRALRTVFFPGGRILKAPRYDRFDVSVQVDPAYRGCRRASAGWELLPERTVRPAAGKLPEFGRSAAFRKLGFRLPGDFEPIPAVLLFFVRFRQAARGSTAADDRNLTIMS